MENWLGFNSGEMLAAVRILSTLEHIDVYERLIWFLVEITLTFDTCQLLDYSTETQGARDAVIAAIEQFCVSDTPKSKVYPIQLTK